MVSPLEWYLSEVMAHVQPITAGHVNPVTQGATNPDIHTVGITLTTVEGCQYSAGAVDHKFAMQSIAKVFSYGLALEDLGPQEVAKAVNVEPSGDAFNMISLEVDGRPANPMITAGAIATVGLIQDHDDTKRITRVSTTMQQAAAGSPGVLEINHDVYQAENLSVGRNRALAWLLHSFGIVETDPEAALQDYLLQSSIDVTTQNLSMMAATLANKGCNPITGAQVFSPETTRHVLSVMMTCGMYNAAGNWMTDVGLPAKSGVDGGIMIVVPGQMGISIYSAPLDTHGNSIRGIAATKRITTDFGLHYADASPLGDSSLRAHYSLADASAGPIRSIELSRTTWQFGHHCHILEASGDLGFAETETMIRTITAMPESVSMVILDFQRVDAYSKATTILLALTLATWRDQAKDMLFIDRDDSLISSILTYSTTRDDLDFPDPRQQPHTTSTGQIDLPSQAHHGTTLGEFRFFDDRAAALEWAELRLAQRYAPQALQTYRTKQQPHIAPIFGFLTDEEADELAAHMQVQHYPAGTVIRQIGQPFDGIYFIRSGRVELSAQGQGETDYRHGYLSAGSTFGQFALGDSCQQLSTIRAVHDVEALVLTAQHIAALEHSNPALAIRLWTAIAREAYTMLGQTSRETGAREQL
ncbi:glutaminase A [Enteractinococcus coprophilus]|uniref:Glutaminase n=1 Tax=Enteractinococcus coprophilus TaxID=1027633 RepID=A0A543ANJ3_9MICC|nr:glutaminase A [Enteractinococcus coprophilus]TQL74150.1 L-glutaminase [Enteractinococcus coprophilus]